ncbi:MAG: transketolase family protein, partial [Spirochaetaceae bacterium]
MAASNGKKLELRDAFGSTLVELGHEYPNMVFLDGDLHTSTKAVMFKETFPTRFYQIGIAEQNLFGVAAGLALEGFIPVPSTFASFVVRRALDQVAISIAYPKLNVKIPGSYVGVPTSRAGASHNCIEDTAVMRSIPHFKIADPGSNRDLASVMRAAMKTDGPVYYRVARYAVPEFLPDDYTFEWGKATVLRDGTDVTLLGTGFMTFSCLEAADLLAKKGIHAEVVHCASIKPLDAETVGESLGRTGCAVTAENASTVGGFGAAVTELMS